ncbi:dTDP-D-glucose 4,6-dehydratase [Pseudomonas duriflava]|uniref:dTDP-D-glucose 4,6-dehydratase n=2 Tax=Pseudomonas duriflava TaxID=459528 RepID=A0A562Q7K0_9PSED|nr:dTDP-D-glucose 4,6-dehydratase [Pseudomonas duriflava]
MRHEADISSENTSLKYLFGSYATHEDNRADVRTLKRVLLIGGSGPLGASITHFLLANTQAQVANLDSGAAPVQHVSGEPSRYHFYAGALVDIAVLRQALDEFQPDAVFYLCSTPGGVDCQMPMLHRQHSNLQITSQLLECTRHYWNTLPAVRKAGFRFLYLCTAGLEEANTNAYENDDLALHASSKAHPARIALAWHRTFGLPVMAVYCVGDQGLHPLVRQALPDMIRSSFAGETLPVHTSSSHGATELYPHLNNYPESFMLLALHGKTGERYSIGHYRCIHDRELVEAVCTALDEVSDYKPKGISHYRDLIKEVPPDTLPDHCHTLQTSFIRDEFFFKVRPPLMTEVRKAVEACMGSTCTQAEAATTANLSYLSMASLMASNNSRFWMLQ